MTPLEQKAWINTEAENAGFNRVGIADAKAIGRQAYVREWLEGGKAGSMAYLHRYLDIRLDPRGLMPNARSVIVFSLSYYQPRPHEPAPDGSSTGRVAMYAWGNDYHKILKKKLFRIADRMRAEWPASFEAKVCVDTAPLIERAMAALAGIGWIGKNTLVLNERDGSYFFLGAIVTTLALTPDEPALDHCGTCTACLDACPTEAFPKPYQMDARKCISYLTIEHRGAIDEALQPAMGNWVFGCDICQEVCPHNRQLQPTGEPGFAVRPPGPSPKLAEISAWSDNDYRDRLRSNAAKRATLDMWKRNAEIATRNQQNAG